ncbi:Uncharacterized membrane protein [Halogeometricum limi]|uniref:Uncharacterized membrane protein n=1 Tax=Halogeometricum limi TaxID=555875 RepID=A0A1I6HTG7_9EURY|nr:Uncharacterized membrane protein [Halogeometricum limi]
MVESRGQYRGDERESRDGATGVGSGESEPRPGPAENPSGDPYVGRGLLDVDMGPSSAMAHLYRGEIHRMKLWRERLDRTTNWAVILMAAVLTWAFSQSTNPHYVVLLGNAAVGLFLTIEARRYRAYDVWRSRVRYLQEHVWAPGLDPSSPLRDENWRSELARDYRNPTLKITFEEALAHRLRRVYLPLFGVLNGAWLLRVTAFSADPWPESAAIGGIPGVVVTAAVVLAFTAATVIACRPRTWHTRGELLSEELRRDQTPNRNPLRTDPESFDETGAETGDSPGDSSGETADVTDGTGGTDTDDADRADTDATGSTAQSASASPEATRDGDDGDGR